MKFSDVFYPQYFVQLLKYKTLSAIGISYTLGKRNEKKGIPVEEGSVAKWEKVQKDECMNVREMFWGRRQNSFPITGSAAY